MGNLSMKQKWASHIQALTGVVLLYGLAILLFHSLAGGTLLAENAYDSYLLQAQNWLQGSVSIQNGENYPWLELAIFQGQYYLSFPPVPSVFAAVLLLLHLPVHSNLLIALYGLAVLVGTYLLFWQSGKSSKSCAFFALFVTLGSNTFWLCTSGGVWMLAQVCCLMFCVWGCFFWLRKQEVPAYFLLALAVGCRPFTALLAGLLYLRPLWQAVVKKQWNHLVKVSVLPALVAAALGYYNWVRFGSFTEFGHNYLPEFVRAEYGQFHLEYLLPNLMNLLRPVLLTDTLDLSFPLFNGFLPILANPLLLLWLIAIAVEMKRGRFDYKDLILVGCFAAMVVGLCLHRTLGGWQFGARYLVDGFPFVLLFFARRKEQDNERWNGLLLAAVLFNFYGAVYMLSH